MDDAAPLGCPVCSSFAISLWSTDDGSGGRCESCGAQWLDTPEGRVVVPAQDDEPLPGSP